MLVATVTPLQSRNELTHWDNRPFCGPWPDHQQYKKPTGVTKPLKKKSRRVRTAYTTEQLRALEKTFTQSRYIDPETRRELARSLKLGEKCIKIWFQNRRMKEKRESSESESSSDVSSENFVVESVELPSPIVCDNEKQVFLQKDNLPVLRKQDKQFFNQETEAPVFNDQQCILQNLEYQPNYAAIYEPSNDIHNQMYSYDNMYQTEYYPNCGQEYYANNANYYQNANYGNVGSSNGYWIANNYYYS